MLALQNTLLEEVDASAGESPEDPALWALTLLALKSIVLQRIDNRQLRFQRDEAVVQHWSTSQRPKRHGKIDEDIISWASADACAWTCEFNSEQSSTLRWMARSIRWMRTIEPAEIL